jgi:hypothetical protein
MHSGPVSLKNSEQLCTTLCVKSPGDVCSLGQALIFTGEAVAVILGGNLAFAFKASNISWRAAPFALAVVAFVVAIAIAVLIREPKKGRFIVQQACPKHAASCTAKLTHSVLFASCTPWNRVLWGSADGLT